MKIWGIGLSRTGTTSLAKILNDAKFKIIHYPTQRQMFLEHNDGGCDITVTANYKKLDRYYPGSKFIYTFRDMDDWVKSIVPYFKRKKDWNQSTEQIRIRKKLYKASFPNEEQARTAWIRHDNDVRFYFRDNPKNLLILDIIGGDNPQKLWEFLDIPTDPPEYFPHENKL